MYKYFKKHNSEKGVSLIITFFIMLIILAVVVSISIILYSEIKVLRNIGDAMVGFYAGDSGVEKVLYYDRQVLLTSTNCSPTVICPAGEVCQNGYCKVSRGLCLMLNSSNNNYYCAASGSNSSSDFCKANPNASIPFSNNIPANTYFAQLNAPSMWEAGYADQSHGCDISVCDDCEVSFNTLLDTGINYLTTTKVYPGGSQYPNANLFEIDSTGYFNNASRQVQLLSSTCSGNWDPATNCTTCLSGWIGATCNTLSP